MCAGSCEPVWNGLFFNHDLHRKPWNLCVSQSTSMAKALIVPTVYLLVIVEAVCSPSCLIFFSKYFPPVLVPSVSCWAWTTLSPCQVRFVPDVIMHHLPDSELLHWELFSDGPQPARIAVDDVLGPITPKLLVLIILSEVSQVLSWN